MQGILKYLPFSGMNYTPVMIYMGKLSMSENLFSIGVQVSWIIILFLLYKLLWSKAIKRVTVMGG